MKRIILAVVTILASAGLTFATTVAAWTDTVSATSIEVDTATTNIQVSNDHGINFSDSKNSLYHLTGLVPNHEKDGGYAFDIKQIADPGQPGVALSGKISAFNFDGSTDPDTTKLQIQVYEIDNPSNASAWQTLSYWLANDVSFNSSVDQTAPKDYGIKVWLDPLALDAWQSRELDFTLDITGTQL